MNRLLHWCSFSWFGHVVLFEAAIAVPLFALLCLGLGFSGKLDASLATTLAVVLLVVAAVAALVTWFSITRPLIRRN